MEGKTLDVVTIHHRNFAKDFALWVWGKSVKSKKLPKGCAEIEALILKYFAENPTPVKMENQKMYDSIVEAVYNLKLNKVIP